MEDDWLTSFEAAGLSPGDAVYYTPSEPQGGYPVEQAQLNADNPDVWGSYYYPNTGGPDYYWTAPELAPTSESPTDQAIRESIAMEQAMQGSGANNTATSNANAGVAGSGSKVSLNPIQKALQALSGSGGSNLGILAALAPILLALAKSSGQSSGSGQSNTPIPAMTASRSRLPYSKNRPGGEGQFSFFSPITYQRMAGGGIANLGGYSDGGRLLKGPGDGVSDDIPATIGEKQPARLADGEFVVPARIVSELGNGSTDAGARKLYDMMRRVEQGRKKTAMAGNSKADKHLPA